ncbi:MAG TPA: glycosyltransferase family 1 protein [Candidatus Saccharimonadales bacterium]
MSKIVIDARQYTTSTGRYAFRLVQYLEKLDANARDGNQHNYVILLKPEDMNAYKFSNPRFTKVATPHKEYTFAEQLGFAWQLYRLKADLVHFSMTQQPLLYRKKSVTTIHDLTTARFYNPDKKRTSFVIKQQVYKFLIKRVARHAKAILTPSEFVKNDVRQFANITADKITVTYEAADTITDSPTALPDLQNKQFIMYIGRPTPHKNLERLIEAYELLRAQHPALTLVLAGKKDANYHRIEASLQKRGLKPPRIIFTDFVTEGQLRWLYENCAAYVFPSLSEGFGLPGLEAMQHGAPVVSSNATCLPEIYGDAAHYFDPLDTQAMADAINEVLTNKTLRKTLIQNGHQQVKKYSWQRMAEQTLEVYNQSLGN